MRNNNISLLSGKVKKVASTSADANRYTFLDLKNSEPDAGVPSSHSSQRGIFGSDINGTRQWFYADAGLSIDVSTGQITVNENTVYIDTALFTNSISDNLAAVLYDLDSNLQELGDNTLSTVATDNTILGAGTTGSPLSIGQAVFFTSKPEFAGLAITPNSINVSGVNLANPVVITTTSAHGLSDGQLITIENITGTTQLNGNNYYVDVQSTSTFTLYSDQALSTSVDGSGYTAYTSSGKILSGGYRFPEADGADGTYLKTNSWGELEFDRPIQYGGTQPTTPDLGDLWLDSITSGDLLIWTGSVWSQCGGNGSQGAFILRQFQGDGSTTAFDTAQPSVNKVLVFLNGILMRLTDDFTFIAGVITFPSAPQTNDTIEVLLTGDASYVGLELLGIDNHDLITVDSAGNVTLIGDLDMGTNRIVNLVDPVNPQDGATKAYVDSIVGATDLDFAGGTGTGTVDLDSQTFTISGTANEIETSAAGQIITIGLPTNITVDVTGNADTATTLASSRDFSLTGAVTASAISFNGSGDVALSTIIDFDVSDNYAFKSITDGTTTAIADSNADTFKIRVQNQIEAIVTNDDATHGDSVLFGHADSGVAANTYGSATAIPNITVDAQGHITAVTTSTISTSWLLSDGVTSESIGGGDTLTVSGTTGEIEVAVSATDTLTIGLPNDVTIGNDLVVTGNLTVNGTTVTVNVATLEVEDKDIVIAKNATTSGQADGAGLIIGSSVATFLYESSGDRFTMSKPLATSLIGNADTATLAADATKLATTRAIEVSGAVTGTANFDGSSAINIVTTATSDPTITLGGDLSGAVTLTNLASGTLTATVGTLNQNTTGSAATLTTARAIALSGDVTGTANFDGSADITISATIAANSVALGTDTTGNYVATISGTANEIEVTGSGTETAGVTVGLPNDVTIGNDLVVTGNLTVNGTTTTINSTELAVDDLNITIASGALTAAAANGAGITVDGAGATLTYTNADDRWNFNKDLTVANVYSNVTGTVSNISNHNTDNLSEGSSNLYYTDVRADARIAAASVDDLNDVDITSSVPTDGQALIWDNANSKFIPGDSFSQGDFDTAFTAKDTDDLSEGATNLYYTDVRADARIAAASIDDLSNVNITGVSNGEILKYVSASSEFQTSLVTTSMMDPTNVFADQFTASGSTDVFTLSDDPGSKNAIQVFVDGVPQLASGYTVVGTTLTLGGIPTAGQIVEVRGYGIALPVGTVADASITGVKLQDGTIGLNKISPSDYYNATTFTAGASQTVYTLSVDPGSPYAITVYVSGVWQKPVTNYSVVGTTMTLASPPTTGAEVYVRYYGVALTVGTVADSSITGAKLQNGTITIDKIAVSAYQNQTFTGDNTTTDFTLNTDPSAAQALLVMVDNVIQEPVENYTTSGTTLTFTGAPSTSARIYVRFLGLPVAIGAPSDGTVTNAALNLTYTSNQYTGNNTTTAYTIQAGHNAHSLLVILDGLILPPSDYSISGSTLTFAAAPLLNQSIDIRYMPV